MGLLGWLFKRFPRTVQGHAPHFNVERAAKRFAGSSSCSKGERYTLGWLQGSEETIQGEQQRFRGGRYLLFEFDRPLVEGGMPRPTRGKVADNGTFILVDSAAYNGTLYAFDVSGKVIVRREFKAHVASIGLSDDGHLAVCQTANSYDEADSSKVTVFDLVEGKEIANWLPTSGWAQFYEFPPGHKTIGLGYNDIGVFHYSLTGEFIDHDVWQDACLEKGQYWTAISMADGLVKEASDKLSPELSAKLIECIDRVESDIKRTDQDTQARALKIRGICLEAQGMKELALSCYDKALALD